MGINQFSGKNHSIQNVCLESNYLLKRVKEGEKEEGENEYIEGITVEWEEEDKRGEDSLILRKEWIQR